MDKDSNMNNKNDDDVIMKIMVDASSSESDMEEFDLINEDLKQEIDEDNNSVDCNYIFDDDNDNDDGSGGDDDDEDYNVDDNDDDEDYNVGDDIIDDDDDDEVSSEEDHHVKKKPRLDIENNLIGNSNRKDNVEKGLFGGKYDEGLDNIEESRAAAVAEVDPVLSIMVGEANVRLAQGDTDNAFRICVEAVREFPNHRLPYDTLSYCHEHVEDHDKALQFKLMGAYIGPTNFDEWVELGTMLRTKGDIKQAVVCYSKALGIQYVNLKVHMFREELLKQLGKEKVAMNGYRRLLSKLRDKDDVVPLSRKVIQYYNQEIMYGRSKRVIMVVVRRFHRFIKTVDLDLYAEALFGLKEYSTFVDIVHKCYRLHILKSDEKVNYEYRILECEIRPKMTKNIRINLIISLINLNQLPFAEKHLRYLLRRKQTVDDIGDRLIHVAKCYMDRDVLEEEPLTILRQLTKSATYGSNLNVWSLLGKYYNRSGDHDESISCYSKCVSLCPERVEDRTALMEQYYKRGLLNEAINLTAEDTVEHLSPLLVYQRCKILFQMDGAEDRFIEAGIKLFSYHTDVLRNRNELERSWDDIKERCSSLHSRCHRAITNSASEDTSPSVREEWGIFSEMCAIYRGRKQYEQLELLTISMLVSEKLQSKLLDICYSAVLSCIFNRDYERGYFLLQTGFMNKDVSEISTQIWNLFSLIYGKCNVPRVRKYLVRLMNKEPNNYTISMLFANHCLLSGTYKYALNDYSVLFRQNSEDPLLALLIAVTTLQLACQKFSSNKDDLVMQMMTFLQKYQRLRGNTFNQEIYYNFGRAFHQLQLLPQATKYYKKALKCPPVLGEPRGPYDLSMETAFNLHLIYKKSGNLNLAAYYVNKYIVI